MNLNTVLLGDKPVTPSKIVCVGRNYVGHIRELHNEVPDRMVIFIKPNSAITDALVALHQEPLSYEAEMCFMVKNQRFHAVAVGLDLTKRGLQGELKEKGLPWERAKAFDGSALFSPFVEIDDPDTSLGIELDINGKSVQSGSIELMISNPQRILQECQGFLTLNDGDIVMTGTPQGVGLVKAGDNFHGKIKHNERIVSEARWIAQ